MTEMPLRYQGDPPTEHLRTPERIHPMDELDPYNPLETKARITLHREALNRVRENANNLAFTPEIPFFPKDVLANEIFVRKVRDKDGKISEVVGGLGLTVSEIPGMDHTPNTIYAHPQHMDRLIGSSPSERQRIFKEEIIAGAEYFVIIGHGWGGKGKNFERYAMELLNGKIKNSTATATDKFGRVIPLDEIDLSKTLVINLDVMGSNNSMDDENYREYTEDKIISQWWEAVDRIGLQVENIKTNSLIKHSTDWEAAQRDDVIMLYESIKVLRYISNADKTKLLGLLQYMDLAKSLEKGTWWQESIAILMGHSMGGKKILDSAVADNLLEKPQIITYRKPWQAQAGKLLSDWRHEIHKMKEHFISQLGQEKLREFYLELDALLEADAPSRFTSETTLDNTPYCMNVSLTPALVGDKNDSKKIHRDYPWMFYRSESTDDTPHDAVKSVKLHREGNIVSRALIHVPRLLSDLRQQKLRSLIISVAEMTPLVKNKLTKHIGVDAEFLDEIREGTADEVKLNGNAVSNDSANLERMKPPFESIEEVSPETWSNFYKNVAVYISGLDSTVGANIIRQLAKKWGLSDARKASEGGIVKESPLSNHHFNRQGVDMLMTDLQAFLARNKMLRNEKIFGIYKRYAGE